MMKRIGVFGLIALMIVMAAGCSTPATDVVPSPTITKQPNMGVSLSTYSAEEFKIAFNNIVSDYEEIGSLEAKTSEKGNAYYYQFENDVSLFLVEDSSTKKIMGVLLSAPFADDSAGPMGYYIALAIRTSCGDDTIKTTDIINNLGLDDVASFTPGYSSTYTFNNNEYGFSISSDEEMSLIIATPDFYDYVDSISSTNKSKEYGLKESAPIIVDGEELGTLTINKVSTMKDRNQFADEDPAQVVLIEYTYKNTADPEEMYIFDAHFQVIDEGGTVCDTYPNSKSKYAKETPIGAKCTAQEIFGLETSSSELTINYKYNMFDNYPTITFKVPVN